MPQVRSDGTARRFGEVASPNRARAAASECAEGGEFECVDRVIEAAVKQTTESRA
jgi:hypothetical protein